MGKFIINGNNVKIVCKFCGKLIGSPNISRHEKACLENPDAMHKCLNCDKMIRKRLKFCTHSCSASYSNSKRIVSEEQKEKVSKTMRVLNNTYDGSSRKIQNRSNVPKHIKYSNYSEFVEIECKICGKKEM